MKKLLFILVVCCLFSCNKKIDKSKLSGTWRFLPENESYHGYYVGQTKEMKYSFDENQLYISTVDTLRGCEVKGVEINFYEWSSENVIKLYRVLPIFIVDSPYVKSPHYLNIELLKLTNENLEVHIYNEIGPKEGPVYKFEKESSLTPKIKKEDLWKVINEKAKKDSNNYLNK